MNESKESKKERLESGLPCIRHRCTQCCVDTEMPLSRSDMKRIRGLGYRLDDFAINTPSERRLKNRSGRCVFLSEDGCKIYPARPEGCKIFPLVYNEESSGTTIDCVCSFGDEFQVTEEDVARLRMLLGQLEKEERKRKQRRNSRKVP